MKIFILTTELTPHNGWGRYSLDLVGALLQASTEVTVAVSRTGRNETGMHALPILPEYLDHRRNYLLAFWYAWKLRKYARDCDSIHSFVEPYSYIAYWLAKITGKKYFITTHGTYGVLPFHLSMYKKYAHKKSFNTACKVICVSNYTQRRLYDFGLTNLLVINNGIHFKKFHYAPIPLFSERHDFILSVGALKQRKGQHLSVEAFSKLSDSQEDLHYYLVGDQGDIRYVRYLKKIIADLGLDDRIHFFCSISDKKLLELYRRAKALVLTPTNTKGHFEGFGLVYLEANACGLPVIGSRNSGAEDAILDGKTGFLVQEGDVQEIAAAIDKLTLDKELWQKLSLEAVQWAEKHDWSRVVREYVRIYQNS